MTTIKEHLAATKAALDWVGKERHDSHWLYLKATEALAAVEAKLDRPMKSAEDWGNQFPNLSVGLQAGDKNEAINFIRAIQDDALASKHTDVDLRQLAYETMSNVMNQFQSFIAEVKVADGFTTYKHVEDIIHAALLEARGGV